MNSDLSKKIEAVLFYLAEPTSLTLLAKTLEVPEENIKSGIKELDRTLTGRGIRIVQNGEEISLVTAPELSEIIEKIIKEERERDLGRAGLETLAIIAYRDSITKKEIEFIRGVNSQYALRNLLLRGLIEKKEDARQAEYGITGDTLRHLGLSRIQDLPEYREVTKEIETAGDMESEETENPDE